MTCIRRSSPKQCSPLQAVRAPLAKCADKENFHLRRLVIYHLKRILQIFVNRPDSKNVTPGFWSKRVVHESYALSLVTPSLIQTISTVSGIKLFEPFPIAIRDDDNHFHERRAQTQQCVESVVPQPLCWF